MEAGWRVLEDDPAFVVCTTLDELKGLNLVHKSGRLRDWGQYPPGVSFVTIEASTSTPAAARVE
jgi:hypothetical protein